MSDQYEKLKQCILWKFNENYYISDAMLTTLKNKYSQYVNSPRRLESIRTLADLIKTLERRSVLSRENVDILKYIAVMVDDTALINNIQVYPQKGGIADTNLQTYKMRNILDKRKELVHKKIINEIGKYWTELARNLNVREYQIDQINTRYNSTEFKIAEVLKLSEEFVDTRQWFLDLCSALEESKRKDLRSEIERIWFINNIK